MRRTLPPSQGGRKARRQQVSRSIRPDPVCDGGDDLGFDPEITMSGQSLAGVRTGRIPALDENELGLGSLAELAHDLARIAGRTDNAAVIAVVHDEHGQAEPR